MSRSPSPKEGRRPKVGRNNSGLSTPRGGGGGVHNNNNRDIVCYQSILRLVNRNQILLVWGIIAIPAIIYTTQFNEQSHEDQLNHRVISKDSNLIRIQKSNKNKYWYSLPFSQSSLKDYSSSEDDVDETSDNHHDGEKGANSLRGKSSSPEKDKNLHGIEIIKDRNADNTDTDNNKDSVDSNTKSSTKQTNAESKSKHPEGKDTEREELDDDVKTTNITDDTEKSSSTDGTTKPDDNSSKNTAETTSTDTNGESDNKNSNSKPDSDDSNASDTDQDEVKEDHATNKADDSEISSDVDGAISAEGEQDDNTSNTNEIASTDDNRDRNEDSENNEEYSALDSFEPSLHPVIPPELYKPNSTNPLQVIYVGSTTTARLVEEDDERELIVKESLLMNGLKRSKYIELVASFVFHGWKLATDSSSQFQKEFVERDVWQETLDTKTPIVIIVDWSGFQRDCHSLHLVLGLVQKQFSPPKEKFDFRMVLVDDSASSRIVRGCPQFDSYNASSISLVKRSIVAGRYWDHSKEWVVPGSLISNQDGNNRIVRLPHTLSEEWVSDLHSLVKQVTKNKEGVDIASKSNARSIDVTVLHNSESSHYSFLIKNVKKSIKSKLKDDVTIEYLQANSRLTDNNEVLNTFLRSKLIVFIQSDEWEGEDDGYRNTGSLLLQAMSCGAMVLCDEMVSKPFGPTNTTYLEYFNSGDSLVSLIRRYLKETDKREEIARRAVQRVLGRHRTYHTVELLLFGKVTTKRDKLWEKASSRIKNEDG